MLRVASWAFDQALVVHAANRANREDRSLLDESAEMANVRRVNRVVFWGIGNRMLRRSQPDDRELLEGKPWHAALCVQCAELEVVRS